MMTLDRKSIVRVIKKIRDNNYIFPIYSNKETEYHSISTDTEVFNIFIEKKKEDIGKNMYIEPTGLMINKYEEKNDKHIYYVHISKYAEATINPLSVAEYFIDVTERTDFDKNLVAIKERTNIITYNDIIMRNGLKNKFLSRNRNNRITSSVMSLLCDAIKEKDDLIAEVLSVYNTFMKESNMFIKTTVDKLDIIYSFNIDKDVFITVLNPLYIISERKSYDTLRVIKSNLEENKAKLESLLDLREKKQKQYRVELKPSSDQIKEDIQMIENCLDNIIEELKDEESEE